MAVVAMMPFLSRVDRQRLHIGSRVRLPGFLEPPLIAGGIHDARRTTPRQGRRDIREFNHADEKQQGRGQLGVTHHGSPVAHTPRHGLPMFRGHRWTIPRWTGTDNSHKRDLPAVTERSTRKPACVRSLCAADVMPLRIVKPSATTRIRSVTAIASAGRIMGEGVRRSARCALRTNPGRISVIPPRALRDRGNDRSYRPAVRRQLSGFREVLSRP
jgi:hypothetical protein